MSDDVMPIDIPAAPITNPGRYLGRRFPKWDVQEFKALSGKSFRQTWALEPEVEYQVTEACLRSFAPSEYQELLSFFGSHFGGNDSFLFTDPEDSSASDPTVQGGGHCFGVGDGSKTAFQLQRRVNALRRDRNSGLKWRSSSGPRTNFLLWANDFTQAAWTKSTGVVAAANGAFAPDPASAAGASVLIYNGTGSAGGARVSQAVAATSTTPFCTSAFLRADAPVTIGLGNAAGIVSTVTLTTSWQRIDWNVTPAIGGDVGLVIYSPAGVNTAFRIYAWGAMSEPDVSNSGTPTKLIPTTTTALTQNPQFWTSFVDSFLPVYEPNGAPQIFRNDWQGVVQLFPWLRTNLCLFSDAPGNAAWTKTRVTVGSAITGPDGAASGFPLTGITSSGGSITQAIAGLTVGQSYTVAAWANCAAGGSLSFGVTGSTSSIVLSAGWQRFTQTFTAAATTATFSLAGWAVGQVVNFAHAQLEAGLVATSQILTLTTAQSLTDYSLALGLVTFAVAPLAGAVLSWLGNFYIRVKLDLSAQTGVELQRIVANMWSTGFQLVSVIP